MKNQLSVAIITHSRLNDLLHAVASLLIQDNIYEILVIDNNSTNGTKQIIERFSKTSRTPIRVIFESNPGRSYARNKALDMCKTRWLAFIDDDCVVSQNWSKAILSTLQKDLPNVVIGKCISYQTSIVPLVENFFERWWKEKNLYRNKVLNYEIFDTKNIIFDRLFLKRNRLSFAPGFGKVIGEDYDLGVRLQATQAKASYQPNAIAYHKYSDTLSDLFKTNYRKMYSTVVINHFHQKLLMFRSPENHPSFWTFFKNISAEHKISSLKAILVLLALKAFIFFNQCLFTILQLYLPTHIKRSDLS